MGEISPEMMESCSIVFKSQEKPTAEGRDRESLDGTQSDDITTGGTVPTVGQPPCQLIAPRGEADQGRHQLVATREEAD